MFKSKYSTILTVLLVILIIAIVIIVVVIGINAYKDYQDSKGRKKVYGEMVEQGESNNNEDNTVVDDNNSYGDYNYILDGNNNNNNTSSGGTTARKKTKYYKEYPMIGYIKISKTNVDYPILTKATPGALDTAVAVMYPSNPTLNKQGVVVIIGHNYRNGKFFSNNKKLVIGDKIEITDLEGKKLTYTIYEISQVPDTDTEYITRERGDNIEIALSTCTDDGKDRLVILARVE